MLSTVYNGEAKTRDALLNLKQLLQSWRGTLTGIESFMVHPSFSLSSVDCCIGRWPAFSSQRSSLWSLFWINPFIRREKFVLCCFSRRNQPRTYSFLRLQNFIFSYAIGVENMLQLLEPGDYLKINFTSFLLTVSFFSFLNLIANTIKSFRIPLFSFFYPVRKIIFCRSLIEKHFFSKNFVKDVQCTESRGLLYPTYVNSYHS